MTAPRVAIVGLGVIGGSLGRALLACGWHVRGYSPDERELAAAGDHGLIAGDLDDRAIRGRLGEATIVVLAVPMSALPQVAARIVAAVGDDTLLVHTASLLGATALGLDSALAERVIGTHPLAGSHKAGFAASDVALFRGCTVVADARAGARDRATIERFWNDAGAGRVVFVEADAHDRALAWTSHLPQLAATALGAALADAAPDTALSGPGLRDTSRLAMSPFSMWRPILEGAPDEAARALRAFEHTIRELGSALERRDFAAVEAIWSRARQWRDTMGGK